MLSATIRLSDAASRRALHRVNAQHDAGSPALTKASRCRDDPSAQPMPHDACAKSRPCAREALESERRWGGSRWIGARRRRLCAAAGSVIASAAVTAVSWQSGRVPITMVGVADVFGRTARAPRIGEWPVWLGRCIAVGSLAAALGARRSSAKWMVAKRPDEGRELRHRSQENGS